jgi:hypothetical protein
MKQTIAVMIFALAGFGLVAFDAHLQGNSNRTETDLARVDQAQGLNIFIQSKPMARYDVLGTVKKTGLVWSGRPKEMYNTLIRRALNDYPNADGIIFDDIDLDHATVIKFAK